VLQAAESLRHRGVQVPEREAELRRLGMLRGRAHMRHLRRRGVVWRPDHRGREVLPAQSELLRRQVLPERERMLSCDVLSEGNDVCAVSRQGFMLSRCPGD
jgi:hypothetical protein